MNDFALLLLFVVSLLAIPFIVRRYRTATALQRRQILFAAVWRICVGWGDALLHRFPMKFLLYGFLGAVIVGGIGFVAGFFGPILFAPSANQGPLLGIFITGPLGIIVGLVGGLIYAAKKRN